MNKIQTNLLFGLIIVAFLLLIAEELQHLLS